MNAIRHISAGLQESDLFATAEFERTVSVWSFAERTKRSEFQTGLDFGGRRLAIQASTRPLVIVGAYHKYGVSAYDASTGECARQRTDIKRVQVVRIAPQVDARASILVGREEGSLLVLDADTGTTLASLRGLTEAFASPNGKLALGELRKAITLHSLPDWDIIWRKKLPSFALLDSSFGPQGVACSFSGEGVECFDLTGDRKWACYPPKGTHILRVAWSDSCGSWFGIAWPYVRGGSKWLVGIHENGEVEWHRDLGRPAETEFFDDARFLITSDGDVSTVPDGRIVWKFARTRRPSRRPH